jgi:hypothetical protein
MAGRHTWDSKRKQGTKYAFYRSAHWLSFKLQHFAAIAQLSRPRRFHIIQLPSSGGYLNATVADDATSIQKITSDRIASRKGVILAMYSDG